MKYKLYNEPNLLYSPKQQILSNRGIPVDEQERWINAGNTDVNNPLKLPHVREACETLLHIIQSGKKAVIVVDCDPDGYTSAAILANYLYDIHPDWTESNLDFIMHTGKQHGLPDVMNKISYDTSLVICPDSSSNDLEEHLELSENGIQCICLDHHEIDNREQLKQDPAFIVNNQIPGTYLGKNLTGAGVTYQFCRAYSLLSSIYDEKARNGFPMPDLCALGLIGDMADYRDPEIRAFVTYGLNHIESHFIKHMIEKNWYSMEKRNGINYLSMAFGVVPYINATIRSGSMEEKELVFKALLTQFATQEVESSNRNIKGSMVPLYEEAVLVAQRCKRRQTEQQDIGMENLESKIENENLLDHKVLLFTCGQDDIEPNIVGLIANKFQAKYQRPTLILRDCGDTLQGSGRNYSMSPIKDFREVCEYTGDVNFASGHSGAFGLSVDAERLYEFIEDLDKAYDGVDFTPLYWVDYIWKPSEVTEDRAMDIASLDVYGQGIPESYIAIEDIPLSESNVTLLGQKKNTIKILVNGCVEMMLFGTDEEAFEEFISGDKYLTIVGKCGINRYNGTEKPQIIVEDYHLKTAWIF